MSAQFLFRCNCDETSGFGHFSRCLSLARTMRARKPSAQVAFLGRYDDFAEKMLRRYRIDQLEAPAQGFAKRDVSSAVAACRGFGALIVDTYHAEQAYIDGLAGRQCKLIVLDDMRVLDLSGADLVISFRAGAEAVSYGARKEALGLKFLVVKPELRKIRLKNLAAAARPLRRVLVFFTGGDPNRAVLKEIVTATVAALPDSAVSYITKDGRPLGGLNGARLLSPRSDIEQLYARNDFIVTGGGLVKYESAYCGIPNASLSQTALQYQDTGILAARNLTLDLGRADRFSVSAFSAALARFAGDPGALASQRRAFRTILTTDGTQRLAKVLLSL